MKQEQGHCNVIVDVKSGEFCKEHADHVIGEGVYAVLMCERHSKRYVDVPNLTVRRRHAGA